jgi:hypothetical protein
MHRTELDSECLAVCDLVLIHQSSDSKKVRFDPCRAAGAAESGLGENAEWSVKQFSTEYGYKFMGRA